MKAYVLGAAALMLAALPAGGQDAPKGDAANGKRIFVSVGCVILWRL